MKINLGTIDISYNQIKHFAYHIGIKGPITRKTAKQVATRKKIKSLFNILITEYLQDLQHNFNESIDKKGFEYEKRN